MTHAQPECGSEFAAEFAALLDECRAAVPDFEELKASISAELEAEDDGAAVLAGFADFEAFFSWWDAITAYDQLDEDERAEDTKLLLEVVYRALLADLPASA